MSKTVMLKLDLGVNKMSTLSDQIYDEVKRRMELAEYHLLVILLERIKPSLDHHAYTALQIMNLKFKYQDTDFCKDRKRELEVKYYDEYGRLRE